MKAKFYLIIFICILYSCKGKNKKEYYDDGILKAEYSVNQEGRLEGERKEYFHSGELSSVGHWENDTLDGDVIHYYLNGKIESKLSFKKGKKNGLFLFYNKDGKVKQKSFWVDGYTHGDVITFLSDSFGGGIEKEYFVNFKGKNTSLGWVSYYKNGNLYDESRRVQFTSSNDTIKLGESFIVDLELRRPRFKKTEFVLGKYDDEFNLTDSTSLDTIVAIDNKAKLKFTPKEKGTKVLRGFARNYEFIEDSLYQQVNLVYFEKKYFVVK